MPFEKVNRRLTHQHSVSIRNRGKILRFMWRAGYKVLGGGAKGCVMSLFFFERRVPATKLNERKPGDHSQLLAENRERHQIVLDVPGGRSISDRKLEAIRDVLDDDAQPCMFSTRRSRTELHSTVRDRRLQALQKLIANGEDASENPKMHSPNG